MEASWKRATTFLPGGWRNALVGTPWTQATWRRHGLHATQRRRPQCSSRLMHLFAFGAHASLESRLDGPLHGQVSVGPRWALPSAPSPVSGAFLASEAFGAMYLWYGLLWVVIEGVRDRRIDLRGRFAEDIERLEPTLRPCRNAIFHIPKRNHDPRLFKPMEMPDSVATISRVSTAFGRLFLQEGAARRQGPNA
jgi:hypothetical protein